MITKWKLFNFKSVRNETDFSIAPLTIFAGANSSGKSTVLQSILLIAQTIENRVSSRSVILNGALTRLGQFDDICSIAKTADQIVIAFECSLPAQSEAIIGDHDIIPFSADDIYYGYDDTFVNSVRCELSFDANLSSPARDRYQLQPRLFGCSLSAQFAETESKRPIENTITLSNVSLSGETNVEKSRRLKISEPGSDQAKLSLNWDVVLDDASLHEIQDRFQSAEFAGCLLRHFLPYTLSIRIDRTLEDSFGLSSVLCDDRPSMRFRRKARTDQILITEPVIRILSKVFETKDLRDANLLGIENLMAHASQSPLTLSDWLSRFRDLPIDQRNTFRRVLNSDTEIRDKISKVYQESRDPNYELVLVSLPESLHSGISYIERFFSGSVKYLGPLRDEPKAMYPLADIHDPFDVGLRGEHTAAVLELHKSRQILYVPSSSFSNPQVNVEPVTRSLETAVVDWLRYLGVASAVKTRDRGKFGHELKVGLHDKEVSHDLTHVGVGVSQVLPILVMSLLAEPDTTLIFEQPELHLHPKVQTLLSDFFLSMIAIGKQCIVETHSEYLINRLRFRAAAASGSMSWADSMKVYFVEMGNEGSLFRDVKINEYGAILDWPEGFFDQSQLEAEAILKAAMLKKKRQSKKVAPKGSNSDE